MDCFMVQHILANDREVAAVAHREAQAIMARVLQAGAARVSSCSDILHGDIKHCN